MSPGRLPGGLPFPLYKMNRFFLICILITVGISPLQADPGWPRFRGLNGSGVNSSGTVPTGLSDETRKWSVEIPGSGHGSPVIFGDRLFLLSAVPQKVDAAGAKEAGKQKKGKAAKGGGGAIAYEWLALCLDRNSGETIWEKKFDQGKFKGHRFNSAASSTPAVDAERVVFAWGPPEQLTVVSLSHDGELQWKEDLGPVVGGHGFGGSPILYRDLVVLNNDQEKQSGNLLALDAATGETKWTVDRRSERISYSVPCVYEADGKELLVFTNWQHGFTAIDPLDGSVVAEKSVFYLETNERAISSPIVSGGLVIGTCGFTANPKHCVAMKLEGGAWKEVWRIEKSVPHIPSLIAVGEHTYLIDDAGIGTCVVTATGEELWRNRIPGVEGSIFGSPVSDGKNIFFADESGNVHVIAASPGFESRGMSRLGELCRTTPAIIGDTIYVRTEAKLSAFGK